MILPRYRIAASLVPGAGKGLYLSEAVPAGRVICAPDAIEQTWTEQQLLGQEALADLHYASARWFEDRYTVSPDWPDECYLNHSFTPTGLWHLGFVFAAADLPEGTEVTIDYRHLLPPGMTEDFVDAVSGEPIIGWSWADSLRHSTSALAGLLTRTDSK
ncbi:SET domain-containing protein [Frateuria aurantia]